MKEFQQIGRYLLMEKIASGGMADVYRARLVGVEGFVKEVAVKKILPHWSGNEDFVSMLIDEAKVLLHLTHANIVQVFELNKENETYFIVMEFIDGLDLRALLRLVEKKHKTLPLPLVLYMAQQICNGLNFAHEKKDRSSQNLGIVHRDVSPQNILISYEGEVKITDFGIAKVIGKTSETVTGTLKGKFAYMSPEQAQGQKINALTDVFSLGILLYEMVTGVRCFKGDNDLETLEAVRQAKVQFPEDSLSTIPEKLKAIILRALKKNKEERYQKISDLRDDLHSLESDMGFWARASDLRVFLDDLCSDKIAKKKEVEEELSHKTKLHLTHSQKETKISPHKTRVLVGDTNILEGSEARKTIVTYAKTFIFDKALTVLAALPQTVITGVSKLTKKRSGRLLFYWGSVFLVALMVFIGIQWTSSRLDESDQKSNLAENAQLEERSKAADDEEAKKGEDSTAEVAEKAPLKVEESKPKTFKGIIEIKAKPVGSLIRIQHLDKKWEKTDENLVELDLEKTETLSLQLQKEGYLAINKKVTLSKDSPTFEETFTLKKAVYGRLMVGAKPWGKVFLPGVTSGSETPFSRSKVPIGSYTLRVVYPPHNKAVSTKVRIRENSLVRCQAQFGDKSSIYCR